jgi:hypothetical protein
MNVLIISDRKIRGEGGGRKARWMVGGEEKRNPDLLVGIQNFVS